MRSIVFFLWLTFIPALLFYHFRKAEQIKEFWDGFLWLWHSLLTAQDQCDKYPRISEACEYGAILAAITIAIAAISLLVFAGFTIYWAG